MISCTKSKFKADDRFGNIYTPETIACFQLTFYVWLKFFLHSFIYLLLTLTITNSHYENSLISKFK